MNEDGSRCLESWWSRKFILLHSLERVCIKAWDNEVKSESLISLLVFCGAINVQLWYDADGTLYLSPVTDFTTCHMSDNSVKLTAVVKVLHHHLNREFYLNQPGAVSVCDAGRRRTCWVETGKGTQTVRKLLSLLAWIINVPTHLAAPDSRKGSGHGVQMFSAQRQHQNFVMCCKCQSDFSSVLRFIPLTCLCSNKRSLNCDKEPFWKVSINICCWRTVGLQKYECKHIFRTACHGFYFFIID